MPPVEGGPLARRSNPIPPAGRAAPRRKAPARAKRHAAPCADTPQKRMRRLRWLCACVVFLAAVLAYFTGLYGASASVLGDKFDTLRALFSEGQEFPFTVRAQGLQNAQPLGGGFVMLTDNELSIYAATAPCCAPCRTPMRARPWRRATRACAQYHRGGTSLTVESRSRTLWEYSAQNAIELCAMSPGGTLAIAQRGQVSVYTPLFEEIFTFTPPSTSRPWRLPKITGTLPWAAPAARTARFRERYTCLPPTPMRRRRPMPCWKTRTACR